MTLTDNTQLKLQIEECFVGHNFPNVEITMKLVILITAREQQARQSELEMFKKVPVQDISSAVAVHISKRYKALSNTKQEEQS